MLPTRRIPRHPCEVSLAMTSRERLARLFRGEPTDRIGLHLRGVAVWDEAWVERQDASFRPVIEAVAEHGDLQARFGLAGGFFLSEWPETTQRFIEPVPGHDDLEAHVTIVPTPRGPLRRVVLVSKIGHPSLTREFFIRTPEDVDAFLSLDYRPPPIDVARFRALTDRLGDRGVVLASVGDPINYVHDLMGTERLAVWSIERRGLVVALLELFADRLAEILRRAIRSGVGPYFADYGQEYAVPPIHSPADFREFVVRYDRKLHEQIHRAGGYVHSHSHGRIGQVLEDFAEAGTDVLHPVEAPPMGDVDLADAKRRIGDRVTLEGNIEIGYVLREDPAAFRARCLAAIEAAKPGGRFILAPTASPYPRRLCPTAVRNYLTMIELACTAGRY